MDETTLALDVLIFSDAFVIAALPHMVFIAAERVTLAMSLKLLRVASPRLSLPRIKELPRRNSVLKGSITVDPSLGSEVCAIKFHEQLPDYRRLEQFVFVRHQPPT
jgi:hypothetical protein